MTEINAFVPFDKVDYEDEDSDDEHPDDGQEEAESSELLEEGSSESPPQSQRKNASKQQNVDSEDMEMRSNSVLRISSIIEDYKYDTEDGLWCEVCTWRIIRGSCQFSAVVINNTAGFVLQLTMVLPISKVHIDLTSVVVKQAQNAVVMETKGITRCLLNEVTTKQGNKELILNTEGINMQELFKYTDVSPENFTWPLTSMVSLLLIMGVFSFFFCL